MTGGLPLDDELPPPLEQATRAREARRANRRLELEEVMAREGSAAVHAAPGPSSSVLRRRRLLLPLGLPESTPRRTVAERHLLVRACVEPARLPAELER